jgi:hypothetical protein
MARLWHKVLCKNSGILQPLLYCSYQDLGVWSFSLFRGRRVRSSACIEYLQAIFTCISLRDKAAFCALFQPTQKAILKGLSPENFFWIRRHIAP